jgi:hypothetical protein
MSRESVGYKNKKKYANFASLGLDIYAKGRGDFMGAVRMCLYSPALIRLDNI